MVEREQQKTKSFQETRRTFLCFVICIVGVNSIAADPFLNIKLYVEIGLFLKNIQKETYVSKKS